MMNSYVVANKTADALADAMLIVGWNATLRAQLGTSARQLVAGKLNPRRIETHNTLMMRYYHCFRMTMKPLLIDTSSILSLEDGLFVFDIVADGR